METATKQTLAFESEASTIGTYKLTAKPSLISEGDFKGELGGVRFMATSPTKTMQWFAINCGQFEKAFSKLAPRWLITETVDALRRGESVEFPGLYQEEQLGRGFHYDWPPVFSGFPCSRVFAGDTEVKVRA